MCTSIWLNYESVNGLPQVFPRETAEKSTSSLFGAFFAAHAQLEMFIDWFMSFVYVS